MLTLENLSAFHNALLALASLEKMESFILQWLNAYQSGIKVKIQLRDRVRDNSESYYWNNEMGSTIADSASELQECSSLRGPDFGLGQYYEWQCYVPDDITT
jgi:predicted heme/steroid binding protein